MIPLRPTKGNAQLTRQNDLSFKLFKLVYCLERNHLTITVWFKKFVCFFKKRYHTAKRAWCWFPRDPSTICLKNARKLKFHVFLLSYARKHMISSFYLKWTKFTKNCEFFSICGSPGTWTKLEEIHNFLLIRSTSCKMAIHMFSSIKMEEYMESELSSIFRAIVVAKNIVLGSSDTHFIILYIWGLKQKVE